MQKLSVSLIGLLLVSSVLGAGSGIVIGSPRLVVTLLNQNPDPVEPGSYVTLRFAIENFGLEDAEDVVFRIVENYPFSIDDDAEIRLGTVAARQTGDDRFVIKYRLRVAKNAVEGLNEVQLEYKTKATSWIRLEAFDVSIQTHDAIIAVTKVTQQPAQCYPGKEVDLNLRIRNYADSLLKDIKLRLELVRSSATATTISYEDLPFSPIGSSNELFVYDLDAKEEKDVSFRLMIDPDAEANVYKIPLSIEYSDHLGNNYSKEIIISVVVGDKPDLLTTIDSTTILRAGMKGEVVIKFVNKGVGKIKFLDVELIETDQYTLLSPARLYVGNIDSDDYETADYKIHVNQNVKDVVLKTVIRYKDSENNDFQQEIDVPLKLYSKSDIEKYQLEKKSNTTGIIIVVVIVVVGIVAYKIIRRRRKR